MIITLMRSEIADRLWHQLVIDCGGYPGEMEQYASLRIEVNRADLVRKRAPLPSYIREGVSEGGSEGTERVEGSQGALEWKHENPPDPRPIHDSRGVLGRV